jgi:hypothetical protein
LFIVTEDENGKTRSINIWDIFTYKNDIRKVVCKEISLHSIATYGNIIPILKLPYVKNILNPSNELKEYRLINITQAKYDLSVFQNDDDDCFDADSKEHSNK